MNQSLGSGRRAATYNQIFNVGAVEPVASAFNDASQRADPVNMMNGEFYHGCR